MPPTRVVFRTDREGFHFAIFPEIPGTIVGDDCLIFDLTDGHTSGPYQENIANSHPAAPETEQQLRAALGYGPLLKVRRASQSMHQHRKENSR